METRRKAAEIVLLRKRNEESRKVKEVVLKERASEMAQQNAVLAQMRREHSVKLQQSVTALRKEKLKAMQETKEEQLLNEKYLAEQRILDRKRALEQKEAIRHQQVAMRQHAVLEKQKQMEAVHSDYDRRLQEELKLQVHKEKELAHLAKLEVELIHRLQLKQQQQREAYEELELALGIRGFMAAEVIPSSLSLSQLS